MTNREEDVRRIDARVRADDVLVDSSSELATRFSSAWVCRNIFPGPFSQNDGEVGEKVIADFVAEAAESGLTVNDLEFAVGDVGDFLRGSYSDANNRWRISCSATP